MEFVREYIHQSLDIITSTISYVLTKIILAIPFMFIFQFLFGLGNEKILSALVVLIIIDFIVGVSASVKLGKPIESRLALKTAIKLTLYALLIAGANMVEYVLPGSPYIVVNGVTSFLAVTVFISIVENISVMGYAVPMKLLNRLQELQGNVGESKVSTTKTVGL